MERRAKRPRSTGKWTYWSPEIRTDCIQHMNLEAKVHVEDTSTPEDIRLEMTRYALDRVSIYMEGEFLKVKITDKEEQSFRMTTDSYPAALVLKTLFSVLKKTVSIERFVYNEEMTTIYSDVLIAELRESGLCRIQVPDVEISMQDDPTAPILFLKAMNANVKKMNVFKWCDAGYEDVVTREAELLDVEQFVTAADFTLSLVPLTEISFVLFLAEYWIDNDAPIGRSLECMSRATNFIWIFFDRFYNRLVFEGRQNLTKYVRIRTNSVGKHIIASLRIVSVNSAPYSDEIVELKCTVINSSEPFPQ